AQDDEDMSSAAVHAGVMKGIARALLFVLTAVALTASVCDADCQSYEYLENNLLRDHWYEMKNYTRAGEEVTEEHEFLSVFNLLCSTIQANEAFYTETLRCSEEKSKRGKIVSVYVEMVNSLVNHSKLTISDVGQLCKYNSCLKSYGTSFINITQFRDIYHKLCESPRVIPACPAPPPSPSPSPSPSPLPSTCPSPSLSPSPSPSPQSTAAAVSPTMPSPAPAAAAASPTAPSPAQLKTSSQPSRAKENST
ncbi:platelet glycoprotein Ib alpha chain-like isoform X4, partial [Clarias magur]